VRSLQNTTSRPYPVVTAPAVTAAVYLCLLSPVLYPARSAHAIGAIGAVLLGSIVIVIVPGLPGRLVIARICVGIALASSLLALRIPPSGDVPFWAIDVRGPVTVVGHAAEDLRPSAGGTRALRVTLDDVHDRRGWRGSAQGELVILWDGPETLLTSRGDRRVVPLRHDGITVTLEAGPGAFRWVSVADITVTPASRRDVSVRRTARSGIRNRLGRLSSSSRGVLAALILGDRAGLDAVLSENVRRSGAAHVLALSGMHLGVLAALLAVATRRLVPRGIAVILGCVLLGVYVWIAGPIASLLRAYAMVCVGAVAILRHRRVPPLVILARSVVVLCAIDPGITRELGFQYSVLALTGLLLLAPGVVAWGEYLLPRRVALYGGTSLAALLVTAPLSVVLFGAFYPAGIIMAGVLSALVVLQIWIGLVYLGVAGVPVVGTAVGQLTEGVTGVLGRVAAAGARVPGFDQVAVPAGRDRGFQLQQPGVIVVSGLLLVSLWLCVLLLRRRRRTRWCTEGSRWNESHLDY